MISCCMILSFERFHSFLLFFALNLLRKVKNKNLFGATFFSKKMLNEPLNSAFCYVNV